VQKALHEHSRVGDFTSFISTATGFGTVSLKKGKVTLRVLHGNIPLNETILNGKPVAV
jgi:hypothetical protein